MATDSQNYGRKVVDSRGGHFRIVSGDPRVGRDGPETFKLYASNDNGEVFLIAHGHGSGLGRIACDKSIEIHAGDKNDPNNVDIRISATTGDIIEFEAIDGTHWLVTANLHTTNANPGSLTVFKDSI